MSNPNGETEKYYYMKNMKHRKAKINGEFPVVFYHQTIVIYSKPLIDQYDINCVSIKKEPFVLSYKRRQEFKITLRVLS